MSLPDAGVTVEPSTSSLNAVVRVDGRPIAWFLHDADAELFASALRRSRQVAAVRAESEETE